MLLKKAQPVEIENVFRNDRVNKITAKKIHVVVLSDTHDQHKLNFLKPHIPGGDLLIHCGDFTDRKDWLQDNKIPQSVANFEQFLASLPQKHKVVIGGNHEIGFPNFTKEEIQNLLPSCTYLLDEEIIIEGLKIYGTPWTNSAMMGYSAPSQESRKKIWEKIPPNLDILVTHQPPFGHHDKNSFGKSVGCAELTEAVSEKNPRVHLFGHIHEGTGFSLGEKTLFVNAANFSSNCIFHFDYFYE